VGGLKGSLLKVLHLALIAALAPVTAVQADATTQLAPVVVTASRSVESVAVVPQFVEVFEKDTLRASGQTNIPDFLKSVGGLEVRTTNAGALGINATVDMRGFGASAKDNTLVLLNGERLNPIDGSLIPWDRIPVAAVNRIEVIHGSGGVEYGDRAVGGVVNVITDSALDSEHRAEVLIGSHGLKGLFLSVGKAAERSASHIHVEEQREDGWREGSRAKRTSINLTQRYELRDAGHLAASLQLGKRTFYSPGGVLGKVGQGDRNRPKFNNVDDRTDSDAYRLSLQNSQVLQSWTLRNRFWIYDRSDLQATPFATTAVKRIDLAKQGWGLSSEVTGAFTQLTRIVFGADVSQDQATYKPNTGDLQDARLDNLGIFGSLRRELAPGLLGSLGTRFQTQHATAYDLTAGVGANRAKKHQQAWAYEAGVIWADSPMADKVSVAYAHGYRFANTDEFWGSQYGPGPGYELQRVFTGILKPQKSDSLDLTFDWGSTADRLTANFFFLTTKDEIRYCVLASCYYGSNINAPRIERKGLNLRLRKPLYKSLVLNTRATLQNAEFARGELSGKKVPLIPETLAGLALEGAITASIKGSVAMSYVGSQRYEGDEGNTLARIPSYTVSDLSLTRTVGPWSLRGSINNLFDRRFASWGGYGFVNLSPTSAGFSYYYYPASPRSLYLSIARSF
jgi:iron complex outermembrane receptor protein